MNDKNIRMKKLATLFLLSVSATVAFAQVWTETDRAEKLDLLKGIEYRVEMQSSFSHVKTPLWLNANKYGLSSLDKINGYMRGVVIRSLDTDSARRWAIGYGLDVVVPLHYTSKMVVQQAFVEARWLHGVLSVGSKEYAMQLKNNLLSSGSQALGINARPVPQVRLALPDYWRLPFGGGWLHLKGHIAYGMMTDDNWQHEFTGRRNRYADKVLYHSKAGYLMIGNPAAFAPLSLEMGLEMACTFGGEAHIKEGATERIIKRKTNLKEFWHAFLPSGQDETDGMYGNIAGNQLGSWLMRLNYDSDTWAARVYADHYFEDHSQMLMLDYNGYGAGDDWNVKKDRRFFLYDMKDIMLGAEVNLKYGTWLRDIVFEYIYTKYQSGPYNHDRTKNISDHVAGVDDYYNHANHTGWQHWGQVMGNPLYLSPIYNKDGVIRVNNNRFVAFHTGVDGSPTEYIDYRIMVTYQKGWGSYYNPYTKMHHGVSFLLETAYRFAHNWKVKGAYAMDFGGIRGRNTGFQFTISKNGLFSR